VRTKLKTIGIYRRYVCLSCMLLLQKIWPPEKDVIDHLAT
jgi:hypothetical protein